MKYAYTLTSRGWITCTVEIKGHEIEIRASYLSDALYDFLSALIRINKYNGVQHAEFAEEPGAYRWIFERHDNLINIQILWFADTLAQEPDENGIVQFNQWCYLYDFNAGVLQGIEELWQIWGEEGYREKWGYKFPHKECEDIKKIVSAS